MKPLAQPLPGDDVEARAAGISKLAALDLGTNNCRLLVAVAEEGQLRIVDSFSRIVRLGEGLAATGRLSSAAMERTISALRVCRQLIDRHAPVTVRCVTTEACRRAGNGPEFLRRVRRTLGLDLEVLDQEEEARLAMLGCMPLVEPDARQILMLDIGGGSTELMWIDRDRANGTAPPGIAISVPLGVVTLSESFGSEPSPAVYAAMVEHISARLTDDGSTASAVAVSLPAAMQMLGTSGTVTTLAAVHLGLRRYDRARVDGVVLPFAAVQAVGAELRAMDNAGRAANACIGRGRADLVVAGCAILDAVHRLWPVDRLRVADRGIREGILSELMGVGLDEALMRSERR